MPAEPRTNGAGGPASAGPDDDPAATTGVVARFNRLVPRAMPPRDRDANRELAVHAKTSQAQYALPRAWTRPRRPRPNSERRLIGKAEVIGRVGVSYQTIWKLMTQGRFPRSIALADKAMWFEDEIDRFIASLPRKVLKRDRRQTVVRMVDRVAQRRRQSSETTETTG